MSLSVQYRNQPGLTFGLRQAKEQTLVQEVIAENVYSRESYSLFDNHLSVLYIQLHNNHSSVFYICMYCIYGNIMRPVSLCSLVHLFLFLIV